MIERKEDGNRDVRQGTLEGSKGQRPETGDIGR